MRKNFAAILGSIVLIAIVTEVLSSKNTPRILGNLSAIFRGSVWSALNPSDPNAHQNTNALFISTAHTLPESSGTDYFGHDVPAAWIIGGGSAAPSVSVPMTPTPNNSPNGKGHKVPDKPNTVLPGTRTD